MGRLRKPKTVLFSLLLGVIVIVLFGWFGQRENEDRALVFHGDASVLSDDTVGKLLVIGGDARVEGAVTAWTAVIDGNLAIAGTGHLSGWVLIINGQLSAAPGAEIHPVLILEVPRDSATVSVAAWLVVSCLVASLSAIAFSAWLSRKILVAGINRIPFLKSLWELRQEHPMVFVTFGLVVSGLLLAVFVRIAEETVYQQEADLLDNLIIWFVRYIATPWLDKAMTIFTYSGAGVVYAVFAPAAVGLLLYRKLRREGAVLVICLGGAALLNFLLKHLFERARPDLYRVIAETGYSFPSGHAMVSFCFYGMVAYIAGRHIASPWKRKLLYGFTALLIGSIGFSRIYLGVHYPSDVAGGYIAGGTWLAFCISFLWWWEHRTEQQRARQSPKINQNNERR